MAKVTLEFEKPIFELEQKVEEMRKYADNPDIAQEIEKIEKRVNQLQRSIFSGLTRWQKVQLARHPERPYTLDYINLMTTDFLELHGDRTFKDDKAIVAGFAKLDGNSVMMIGHQKGRDTKSNLYRNFGMPNPEGYRKALRLMKLAEKFKKPVITLLDTPGAFPGLEAEERGQAEAIARNLYEMSHLKVPIIVVIIGEGASGGALGIGVGDRILMLEYSWYSVISPESCSSILWRSWDYKEQAAEALQLTALRKSGWRGPVAHLGVNDAHLVGIAVGNKTPLRRPGVIAPPPAKSGGVRFDQQFRFELSFFILQHVSQPEIVVRFPTGGQAGGDGCGVGDLQSGFVGNGGVPIGPQDVIHPQTTRYRPLSRTHQPQFVEMFAIVQAARMIRCGEAEIVLAGGTENMSMAPLLTPSR